MIIEANPMRTRRSHRSRGLTLIEIMIALSMLAIVSMALTTMLVTSMNLQRINKEMDVAMYVAQSAIDSIRAYPDFDKMYVAFNANTGDDPPVPLASVWSPPDFAAMMRDPAGLQILDEGQVSFLFPGDGTNLLETETGPWFIDVDGNETNRSIDGNNTVNTTSVATTYEMLPVMVRVTWVRGTLETGAPDIWTYDLRTVIAKK